MIDIYNGILASGLLDCVGRGDHTFEFSIPLGDYNRAILSDAFNHVLGSLPYLNGTIEYDMTDIRFILWLKHIPTEGLAIESDREMIVNFIMDRREMKFASALMNDLLMTYMKSHNTYEEYMTILHSGIHIGELTSEDMRFLRLLELDLRKKGRGISVENDSEMKIIKIIPHLNQD